MKRIESLEEDNERTEKEIIMIKENLQMLEDLVDKDYELVDNYGFFDEQKHELFYATEARKILQERGYKYIHNYPLLGELWIKEKE